MSAVISFDAALFRAQCAAYADVVAYPDALIEGYWEQATSFVSDANFGYLKDAGRRMAINWMVAHLMYLAGLIAAGQTPGQMQSSTIDKISISMTPPPNRNQWQWWLGVSPYGQQLLALLQASSVGGMYIGGVAEGAAFRKAWGCF